jgi:hypothetical protein
LALLPDGVLAEVLGLVPAGERGPARQACRALLDAACQAARCLRIACLPPGAGGGPEPAAVLRALRRRPGLEELVLDHGEGGVQQGPHGEGGMQQEPHGLAILGALGPGGSGVGGGPPQAAGAAEPPAAPTLLPLTKLVLRGWPDVSEGAAAALGRALRPGGALCNVRALELRLRRGFCHELPRALPPGLRVCVSVLARSPCLGSRDELLMSVLQWACAEARGAAPVEGGVGDGPHSALGVLKALEAQPWVGRAEAQGPAAALLVRLDLSKTWMSPELARALALLPSLEALAVGGEDRYGLPQELFVQAVGHLARCPALRELRVRGKQQQLWAWAAWAVLAPRGVRCEVADDVEGPIELDWPFFAEISAGEVQAAAQGMAGCVRPPTDLVLYGRWGWLHGGRWTVMKGGRDTGCGVVHRLFCRF